MATTSLLQKYQCLQIKKSGLAADTFAKLAVSTQNINDTSKWNPVATHRLMKWGNIRIDTNFTSFASLSIKKYISGVRFFGFTSRYITESVTTDMAKGYFRADDNILRFTKPPWKAIAVSSDYGAGQALPKGTVIQIWGRKANKDYKVIEVNA